MKRPARSLRRVHRLTVVLAAALAASCGLISNESYELARGYSGWVFIGYGVPACSPLPTVNGQRVHRIPANGILCTSSPERSGWARSAFYEGTGSTRVEIPSSGAQDIRRIWSPMSGEGGITGYRTAAFFVGTWQEHQAKTAEVERLAQIQWGAVQQ